MLTCCLSEEKKIAQRVSQEIEKELRRSKRESKRELKLLLLGTGESGKSTFIKQMRIIHGDGFSKEEKRKFSRLVYRNLIAAMKCLIEAATFCNIPYSGAKSEDYVRLVKSVDCSNLLALDAELVEALRALWADAGIQQCVSDRRRDFHLPDSAHYYLSEMTRISDVDYLPSEQDILRVRVPTTGIVEY
ncbi:unnamed protein product, partial [Notodromas monacha]